MPDPTVNALMAATVVITNGAAGVTVNAFTSDGTAKAASYEGFFVTGSGTGVPPADIGTNIVLPLALKTDDGYYTQALLSNPNSSAANVTLTYSGNTGTHVVKMTVPANGVANHSVYSDNIVPLGFVGSATVTSDQPVAAVLFRAKKVSPTSDYDEDLYTAVNGVPAVRAAKTLRLPVILRRYLADDSHVGENSWVSVTVPGGGTANLTLRSIGGCTSATLTDVYTTTKQINGSFIFYENADTDSGFGSNPACFAGAMTITSDVPVVAVASFISDLGSGDQEGVYNAFPDP
jgi:hypothetical protein